MIVWRGVREFQLSLTEVVTFIDEAARESIAEIAATLEESAKENASGRPGPEVISGHLRGGIETAPIQRVGGHRWGTQVGPTMIYSRRVELGFTGTDSLGRSYEQPGYPYFVPAYAKTALVAQDIFRKRTTLALAKHKH